MSQLTDKVEKAIEANIKELGLELEYTELIKEGENNIFRIVIDKPNDKVSVEDCEALSRSVEDTVDSFINVKEGYVLEVSSAGIERQLKNAKLYNKYIGYEINVRLFKKINGLKEYIGKLKNVEQDYIIIETENDNLKIDLKDIAHANTVYNFDI